MNYWFSDLTYPAAGALLEGQVTPVLLLPLGATEPHGPHSPLSTDVVISLGMCKRACDMLADDPDLRALILPPLEYGVTQYARAFPGRISIRQETLQAILIDLCTSLAEQNFRYLIVVNNHFEPEHVQAIHRALDQIPEQCGMTVGYLDLTRKERAQRLTEEFRSGECHAGRYETSLVLAERPELINREAIASLPYVPVNLAEVIAAGMKEFREMGLDRAYCGSPADATREEGEGSFEILTDMLVSSARALVDGTGGRDRPGLYGRV